MKPVWLEPLEQTAHFLIGLVAPAWGAWREHRQWPPGDPLLVVTQEYYHESRVRDAYRDFTAYLIGSQVAIIVLVGLLVRRW
jgi:hypothetical protein